MEVTTRNLKNMQNVIAWINEEDMPFDAFRRQNGHLNPILRIIWILHRLRVPLKRKMTGAIHVLRELM